MATIQTLFNDDPAGVRVTLDTNRVKINDNFTAINTDLLTRYVKPAPGIPASDMTAVIQAVLTGCSSDYGYDATASGLLPNTGADITATWQTAINAANAAGLPLIVKPGKYIYNNRILNARYGLICLGGVAWFDSQNTNYTNCTVEFNASDSSILPSVVVKNIKFTCSTRPDSGLSNDAPEEAGFLKVTGARNVYITGCEFRHGWGGGPLLRDVTNAVVSFNRCHDLWKDCFHVTDASSGIVYIGNEVYGGGDDAFAAVSYTSRPTKRPSGVFYIGNKVHGVRKARAFAVVGADNVFGDGNYVNGLIPADIPQQVSSTGWVYRTACGLYISAESNGASSTQGCKNVRFINHHMDGIANGIWGTGATGGTPGTPAQYLNQITIVGGNGTSDLTLLKDIYVQAVCTNGASKGAFIQGSVAGTTTKTYSLQNVNLDITIENNMDPYGLENLAGTPNTYSTNGVEMQGVRNATVNIRANMVGQGVFYADANCAGRFDVKASIFNVCQLAVRSVLQFADNTNVDEVDWDLNFEVVPPATGAGQVDTLILNNTPGITRSTRVTGVDHGNSGGNVLYGWPNRNLSLSASPATVLNITGRRQLLQITQGTVSDISRTWVVGRAPIASVTDTTHFTLLGDFTDVYVSGKSATFFSARGVSLGAAVAVTSSAFASGVTTVTLGAAMPTTAAGQQVAVVNTQRTLVNRHNGIVELSPETAVRITYSAAPGIGITEPSF